MTKIKLHNHNLETYNNVIDLWNKGLSRVGIVQATGTGKSYIIGRILEDFQNDEVLVLAPKHHMLRNIELLMPDNPNHTYMTYSKLHKSIKNIEELKFKLIVLDEFHRCGSSAWGDSINKLLLINECSKVLGATATDIRYLDNHKDMSNELFHNCLACKSDLSDAINSGILPMPKYVTALYSVDEEVEKLKQKIYRDNLNLEDSSKLLLDELDGLKSWNSTVGVPNVLKKHMDKSINKFVVFCKNVKHIDESIDIVSQWFSELNLFNDIQTYKISHQYGKDKTESILDEFKHGNDKSLHLLFSVDILNEGLHIDSSGVILLRETSSPTVFFQQIGRAMSASNDSQPIIFDFVNNFKSLKGYMFKNALSQSKDRLISSGHEVKPIDFTIYDESKQFRDILNSISERIPSSWDSMFSQLYEFYLREGNVDISFNNKEYKHLYKWSCSQRVFNNKGVLSDSQFNKLDSIGFSWDVKSEKWMINYHKLLKFYNENGNTKVPYSYSKSLNVWCASQRLKKDSLPEHQVELLNNLSFQWKVLEEDFQMKIDELNEYKEKHGDVNIPRRYKENSALSNWVQRIRSMYSDGILSDDKIVALESIGFVWNIELNRWNSRFDELDKYYSETNDLLNRGEISKNKVLKDWVVRQRQAFRNNKLTQHKIDKLKSINFMFEIC